jgi:hypothetical protein
MEPLKPVPNLEVGQRSLVEPITRVRVGKELEVVDHHSYRSRHFYEAAGNAVTFKNCDFSFSVIERSYFRNAVFENCSFTGAKLLDSSFRSATFSNCNFQYTTVHRCNVPVMELLRNLPSFPNIRREFLQQLRANATSMGDSSHINQLVAKELDAERDYWREARKRSSAYYEKKYGSVRGSLIATWHSLSLAVDRFVWGHGESIARLLVATLVAIAILSFVRWVTTAPGQIGELSLGELWKAIRFTWAVYLDLPIPGDALEGQRLWGSAVLLTRYLSIGLFISVVFRKHSKR